MNRSLNLLSLLKGFPLMMQGTRIKASHQSSNFSPGFLFLSKNQRFALENVYAFCRAVDDAVDEEEDPEKSKATLSFWRDAVEKNVNGFPDSQLAQKIRQVRSEFGIPAGLFFDVIKGVEMDLTKKRYESFEELKVYCYGVASAVGLICLPIFGVKEDTGRDFAIALGTAFQLTNILRDIKGDAECGRIYIPQQDLRKFGVSEDDLLKGRGGEKFLKLMDDQIARARAHYALARSSFPEPFRRELLPALVMASVYRKILERVAEAPGDVLRRRIGLSRFEKFILALWTWSRVRSGGPPL